MKEVLNPLEIVDAYLAGVDNKVRYSFWRLWFLGMMAGAFIALGAAASNVVMHNISNVGLQRFLGAAIFPIGLMLIIVVGGELFTGDCLVLLGVVNGRISWPQFFKLLVIVFFSNFAGAVLVAALVSLSGQWHYSSDLLGAFTYRMAVTKSQISPVAALASGILCNIMVCSAVLMALSCKSAAGKILSCFFIIMGFVLSGYEHCVANMYYLSAGYFASLNPAYVLKATEVYGALPALEFGNMLMSLVMVTIGNIIGGCAVALVMQQVKANKLLN